MEPQLPQLRWDVFCRVVDNHGDLGVCWRLAADLAGRGQAVRLWVDDPAALAWMAPDGAAGVEVVPWRPGATQQAPGDVVVETFGCDPPEDFVERMATLPRPPLWLNLEYLSAEAYVERSHRLPSPQRNGLVKWFFYPGFTPATGGLLREPGLLARHERFDRTAWLASHQIVLQPGERVASVFCYPGAPLELLAELAAGQPLLLLTCPGAATAWAQGRIWPAGLRHLALPWLPQPAYDQLLRACDLNVVRGEDSFVRAQWAGRPFLWHIYPQADGAHGPKLEAFLARLLHGADPALAPAVRGLWRRFNRLQPAGEGGPAVAAPEPAAWQALALRWQQQLACQPDLVTQLFSFVQEKG